MGITGNIDVKGNVTARNFIVSSSVTSIEYQNLSGSTIFGDSADDTHQFTGSIEATNVTASIGRILMPNTGQIQIPQPGGGTFKILTTGNQTSIEGGNITLTSGQGLKATRFQSNEINTYSNSKDAIDIGEGYTGGIRWGYVEIFSNDSKTWSAGQAQLTVAPASGSLEGIKIVGHEGQTADYLRIQSGSANLLNITPNGSVSGSSTSTGSFGTINVDFWNKGIGDQTNTYIGHEVGDNLTDLNTTPNNTYIGYRAGKNATFTNSRFNTVIGAAALDSAVSASSNVIIGKGAAGAWDTASDNDSNVVIGTDAFLYNAGGERNIAIGAQSLVYSTDAKTGNDNIAMGQYVLGKATSATANIALGQGSMVDNIDGNYNVAIGRNSLPNIVSTDYNVAIGERALFALSGSNSHNNVAVGKYAGYHIANGSTSHYGGINSIFIGTDTKALADNETNQIVIGYDAIGKGSNTVVLGDDNITDIYMSEDVGAKLHTGDVSGSSTSTGSFGVYGNHFIPSVDNTHSLGTATHRWSDVFTTDLQLSNEGKPEGNEVDGTTGSWTIQEGEDNLYLLNRKNGKKYKFKLEEIG